MKKGRKARAWRRRAEEPRRVYEHHRNTLVLGGASPARSADSAAVPARACEIRRPMGLAIDRFAARDSRRARERRVTWAHEPDQGCGVGYDLWINSTLEAESAASPRVPHPGPPRIHKKSLQRPVPVRGPFAVGGNLPLREPAPRSVACPRAPVCDPQSQLRKACKDVGHRKSSERPPRRRPFAIAPLTFPSTPRLAARPNARRSRGERKRWPKFATKWRARVRN